MIQGSQVSLRKADEASRFKIYKWLTRSDVTPSMMGPPDFPDHPIPMWSDFCADYAPHYFDDSAPRLGRLFMIAVEEGVGVIGYNEIHKRKKEAELDIRLRPASVCYRSRFENR